MVETIQVQNGRQFRAAFKKAGHDVTDLKEAHAAVAGIVSTAARFGAPVSSGKLASSGRASGTVSASIVRFGGARVPYANPQHWGWWKRHIKPNPWVTEAAQETEPRWSALFYARIDQILSTIQGATRGR